MPGLYSAFAPSVPHTAVEFLAAEPCLAQVPENHYR